MTKKHRLISYLKKKLNIKAYEDHMLIDVNISTMLETLRKRKLLGSTRVEVVKQTAVAYAKLSVAYVSRDTY